ncbi:L-rhamnose mutarotase [Mangrovibacterium lignilyticum]|uniref:L-rhamnose mutarotase n=1 Tax=Mangrovibacterium lignilyticum TaxID=2668052 RepID=UPI0013D746D8|nr:L-rhamnose mutarotase [Mangrovibacterium lignilyticum]
MKKINLIRVFGGYFILLLLASCNQSGKKVTVAGEESTAESYRVAIELILEEEPLVDSLADQLGETGLDSYRWKNHLVLFGEAADTSGLSKKILKTGIKLQIKYYNAPFYAFDRTKDCGDSSVVKPWRDYLLTANLVDDSVAQAEYIHYHAVQFDEWPEVAEGFCYAGFQQLLVFRTGRQLMLVISIPADKTLDELDPKTVENNPRMVEWNNIMSKYQEGIEGTEPGETWVFLDPVQPREK